MLFHAPTWSKITRSEHAFCTQWSQADPACERLLDVFMCYKGFQAISLARVANHYWNEPNGTGITIVSSFSLKGSRVAGHTCPTPAFVCGGTQARLLQSEASDIFGVDIHPAARLGGGEPFRHTASRSDAGSLRDHEKLTLRNDAMQGSC